MWVPTHVQVTVQRANGLLIKGKNHTNDCFVTIALGKTKYQTSVKEKAESDVDFHEECELPIPEQGNTAEIVLTALHHNFLGVDEFLGRVTIPLNGLDVYERPKNRWYPLQSKKKEKIKERGKLEVKIAFLVKSGSLSDLSKKEKHKSSIGHIAQSVGGSLLSITSIEKRSKGIKKIASSIGSKINLRSKKKSNDFDDASSIGSIDSLRRNNDFGSKLFKSRQTMEDADPGVVSDEDDEFAFDDLSHKSSGSSLNQTVHSSNVKVPSVTVSETSPTINEETQRNNLTGAVIPIKPPRAEVKLPQDEWDLKLYGKQSNKNGSLLKPKSETLTRKVWESPKLSTRIEEEDSVLDLTDAEENSKEHSRTCPASPVNKSPPQTLRKTEDKESMLSKLMKIRKNSERNQHEFPSLDSKIDRNGFDKNDCSINTDGEPKVSTNNRISSEIVKKFDGKSRDELILLICDMQSEVERYRKKMGDLEDYLDELLLRVMETTPKILQNPYVGCKINL